MHDVIAHSGKYQSLFQLKINLSYRYYDKFVILSELFRRFLINKGISDSNIIHIPHANFDYYSNSLFVSSSTPKQIIGFLEQFQNIRVLIDYYLLFQIA